MVKNTHADFIIEDICADGAYASKKNAEFAGDLGAQLYTPVEARVRDNHGPQHWRRVVALFRLHEDEFRAHYHQRSKVETVFSMVKTKFKGYVRSKNRVAQENEILCKFILHNFRVVIAGMYARGEPGTLLPEKRRGHLAHGRPEAISHDLHL